MRWWGRAGLLGLATILFCVGVAGMADEVQWTADPMAGYSVEWILDAREAMDEPWSRWMSELVDAAKIVIWGDNGYSELGIWINGNHAATIGVWESGYDLIVSSTTHDQAFRIHSMCDWITELKDAVTYGASLKEPCMVQSVSSQAFVEMAKIGALRLRAYGALARATAARNCQACGTCDVCQLISCSDALAGVVDVIALSFESVIDDSTLTIIIEESEEKNTVPTMPHDVTKAPDELSIMLIEQIARAICRAIV